MYNSYYGGYSGGGYGIGFDWTYILVLIGLVLSLIASALVKSTFNKYSKVVARNGMTGLTTAQMILKSAGMPNMPIRQVEGSMTDFYDPKSKSLSLSQTTYGVNSVAACGVAAHECGHAIQDQTNYGPLALRSTLYPAANFGQKIAWPAIIIGLIFSSSFGMLLLKIGIIAFSLGVLFQLITLPVEFNASKRAVAVLAQSGMMDQSELDGVKKVLRAAALTYVAAAAASILSLLRLILLSRNRKR